MEFGASSLKIGHLSATSITQRLIIPASLATPWPFAAKPNTLTLYYFSSSLIQRNNTLLTRSTKSDTNTNKETGSNENVDWSSSPSSSLSEGLVLDLGSGKSWDGKEIGSPVVKRFVGDEEERWHIWYYGNSGEDPGLDSVGLAMSGDGIQWKRGAKTVGSKFDVGAVMDCSQDWWAFDTMSIRPNEVIVMSSGKVRFSDAVYWLYYTGYSSEKVDFAQNDSLLFELENPERFGLSDVRNNDKGEIFKSLPGLAISQDGRYWARIEGEHHSGALFDVGNEGEWDSLFIAGAQVVFHDKNDLRMYYHSFDVEKREFGIGVARSRDGIRWVKLRKIMGGGGKIGCFDEFGVMNPCVVRNKEDGKYVMAYEGVGGGGDGKRRRSIGLAMSPDGLKEWRRYGDEAVLNASEKEDGWDNNGVGNPCLVPMQWEDDKWRLYYRGVGDGGRTGIGMAASQGNDLSSFRRWAGS